MEPGALFCFLSRGFCADSITMVDDMMILESNVVAPLRVIWNHVLPSFSTTETRDAVLALSINSRDQPASPTLVCCACGGWGGKVVFTINSSAGA